MNTTRSFGNFLSYANTGNNGAPVPQEFVNTQPENLLVVCILLGANLPNNQFDLTDFAQQAMLGYQGFVLNAVDVNNNNSVIPQM
jgi:hypothetical protein